MGTTWGNSTFVWTVPSSDESAFDRCLPVIEAIKEKIAVFHTRAMRKEMFWKFGRLSSMKPAGMWYIYRSLTGEYKV